MEKKQRRTEFIFSPALNTISRMVFKIKSALRALVFQFENGELQEKEIEEKIKLKWDSVE